MILNIVSCVLSIIAMVWSTYTSVTWRRRYLQLLAEVERDKAAVVKPAEAEASKSQSNP